MKNYLLLFLCLFTFNVLYAQQNITVRGKVTDASSGQPLVGAGVQVRGTTQGSVTDSDGNFSIDNVLNNATLVISYLGYQQQNVPVNNRAAVNIQLVASTNELEQVVVVGYGAQRKQDLTGSVASVAGAELAKQPVQTATQALQGKAAGVQIVASGRPNEQPVVRVRGTGSMLAGANPLYVVDGVLTDDIRNINTADIVSMNVLKDASAAIYGVRAANGVIIITTKRGEAGKTKINYTSHTGFREAANLVQMANREQYIDYLQVASPAKFNSLEADIKAERIRAEGSTNWYDEVLRRAFQTNHNVSFSGGSDRSTFFVSAGLISEDGIIETNDFKRVNFRANNDINLSDKFKFSSQLGFSRANGREVEVGDNYRNVYRASPLVAARVNGRYGNTSLYQSVGNPVVSLENRNQEITNNRLQGNIALDYNPVQSLTFRTAFNTDLIFNKDREYHSQLLNSDAFFFPAGGNQQALNSRLNLRENKALRYVWDNTVSFNKVFDKHSLNLVGGAVTEQFVSEFISGSRINVPASKDQWYLGLGNPGQELANNSGGDKFARQSFLGRVNYGYDRKYLLTASLRSDASSKFKEKWGMFPTVGLGWVVSEEGFLKSQSVLDYLKFRGSYGILGNDNIESGLYIVTAGINVPYFFNNNLVLGSIIQDIKDPNLKWEKTEQVDFGFEFALLNNRLTGEVDYYNKETRDALVRLSIPAIFGDPDNTYITNAASFVNRGLEFALNWDDSFGDDFRYRFGGNITFNRNRVVGLSGGQALLSGAVGQQSFTTRTDEGQPVGSFWVLKNTGVFQTQEEIDNSPVYGNRANVRPGDLKYEDISGPNGVPDGIIDDNDRIFAGSYQPKLYYGINLGMEFKGFDLSADFYGNAGNKIYNGKKAFRFEVTDNIEADYANNRWTPSNPSQTDPRIITNATPASTYFIESGSFLRLNNLTLGYTIPKSVFGNWETLSNFRVFATSQNLFTYQKFSGFSPELSGGPLDSGIELNIYPTTRTFAFGLNIGF